MIFHLIDLYKLDNEIKRGQSGHGHRGILIRFAITIYWIIIFKVGLYGILFLKRKTSFKSFIA